MGSSITKPDPIKVIAPNVIGIYFTSYEATPIIGGIGVMIIGSTNIID